MIYNAKHRENHIPIKRQQLIATLGRRYDEHTWKTKNIIPCHIDNIPYGEGKIKEVCYHNMAERSVKKWIQEAGQIMENSKRDMKVGELQEIVAKNGGYSNLNLFECLSDIFLFGVKVGIEHQKGLSRKGA